MALLAAYEILVSRQSGQNDFAIGTMVANWQLSCTERLIGFFANNLVVRANLFGTHPSASSSGESARLR